MSDDQTLQKLRASREFLYRLFDREERRELTLAIRLINREMKRLGGEEAVASRPLPEPEPELDDYELVEPESRSVLPEPEDTPEAIPEPAVDVNDDERDRESERRRREQMLLEQISAGRIQALKTDMLRFEESRLEALDDKDSECTRIDAALEKIETRRDGIERRREQAHKDQQTLRDEHVKRGKQLSEDDKALEELREYVARLQRELNTAGQREKELHDSVSKLRERIANEEQALAEIKSRCEQFDEHDKQAARDVATLYEQRKTLEKDYVDRFSSLEEGFLRAHWAQPPVSEEHLREALRASATLLDTDEKAVRERLAALDMAANLTVRQPDLEAYTTGEGAPDTSGAHASLQNFLKLVKS